MANLNVYIHYLIINVIKFQKKYPRNYLIGCITCLPKSISLLPNEHTRKRHGYQTVYTVPTFNSWQPGHNTRPHARLPPRFLGMYAWMTSQLNVALIRKLRGALLCLAYFFDMLSMGFCKTRHGQTSGRLVQELNVCNVHVDTFVFVSPLIL